MGQKSRSCHGRKNAPQDMLDRAQASARETAMNRFSFPQERYVSNAQLDACLQQQNRILCEIERKLDWIIGQLKQEK